MKTILIILILLSVSISAQDNLFKSGDFESGNLSDIIGWCPGKSVKLIKGAAQKGKWVLSFPAFKKVSYRTITVKIEKHKLYELSFYAKINETDFYFKDVVFIRDVWCKTKSLPEWKIVFYSDEERIIPISRICYRRFDRKIISNIWQKYTIPFYAPIGAKSIAIQFNNGNDMYELLLDDISVKEAKVETLNLNPDFSLGQYNYSGYNNAYKSWIIPKKDQQGFYMDCTQGHVIGDPIPAGKGNYSIAVTAKPIKLTKRLAKRIVPRFYIDFYDGRMKRMPKNKIKSIYFRWSPAITDWKTQTYDFKIQAQVKFIRLRFGGGYYDEIVLTKENKGTN